MVVQYDFGVTHTFNLVCMNTQQVLTEVSQVGNGQELKHVHLDILEVVQHNVTGIVGKRL